jgi:hypothetical protein
MKKTSLLILFAFLAFSSYAQLPGSLKDKTAGLSVPGGTPNIGSLIGQFSNGLSPAAFGSNWAGGKGGFMKSLGKISSAAAAGQAISSLVGFIKPSMFKKGFDVNSLLKTAGTVSTMSQAAGLMKNLDGGLLSSAFGKSWGGKRSAWSSALDLLQ